MLIGEGGFEDWGRGKGNFIEHGGLIECKRILEYHNMKIRKGISLFLNTEFNNNILILCLIQIFYIRKIVFVNEFLYRGIGFEILSRAFQIEN